MRGTQLSEEEIQELADARNIEVRQSTLCSIEDTLRTLSRQPANPDPVLIGAVLPILTTPGSLLHQTCLAHEICVPLVRALQDGIKPHYSALLNQEEIIEYWSELLEALEAIATDPSPNQDLQDAWEIIQSCFQTISNRIATAR